MQPDGRMDGVFSPDRPHGVSRLSEGSPMSMGTERAGKMRSISPSDDRIFDPQRFAHLSEEDALKRIGALLAIALIRSGKLRSGTAKQDEALAAPHGDALELIRDPIARKLASFLQVAGPTSPAEMAAALGIPCRTVASKLRHLRANGVCDVRGKTRAASYRLRTDHGRN